MALPKLVFSPTAKKIKGYTSANILNIGDAVLTSTARTFPEEREIVADSAPDITYEEVQPEHTVQDVTLAFPSAPAELAGELYLGVANSGLASAVGMTVLPKRVDEFMGGTTKVTVGSRGYSAHVAAEVVVPSGLQRVNNIIDFTAGSLAAHCKAQVQGLIAGHTPGRATQEYMLTTNNSDVDPQVTISTHPFIQQFDFTGVSVISGNEDEYPGILISPRHLMSSEHTLRGVNAQYTFRRQNGTYQTVTVVDRYLLPNGLDLGIALLSEDVTGCAIYKTMPAGWETNYCPSLVTPANQFNAYGGGFSAIPYIRKAAHLSDAESWVSAIVVNHLYWSSVSSITNTPGVTAPYTVEMDRAWGVNDAYGGDSGGPGFLIINSEQILITSQSNATSSIAPSGYISEFNTAMNDLAGVPQGTYALTHPDLSMFTNYGV